MATQRYISTSFWDDEWIQTLDPSEKLLYLYLMTNPLTNISGVYKISARRIVFDTGFNSDTVGHIMAKFEKAGKAFRIGEYVALPAWPKHQMIDKSPKIRAGVLGELEKLAPEVLVRLVEIGYRLDLRPVFDTLSIPYTKGSNYLDLDLDSDIDIDQDLTIAPEAPPDSLNISLNTSSPIEASAPPSDPKKALEAKLWQKFLAIQPDQRFPSSTYAKERKGVQRLALEAVTRQPADPEAWIGAYIEAWMRLKSDRKSLIYSQPSTPAAMSSGALMARVLDEMAQHKLVPDESIDIPWGRL